MSIDIRIPKSPEEWENYYDLRYRVLRAPLNQERGSERNEGDASGHHFALYDSGILKAIARLDRADDGVAQTRFVAVELESQGKGYGKHIMLDVERAASERGDHLMILHARDYAVIFYKKLGYELVEESYKLFDVLQHYLMHKAL